MKKLLCTLLAAMMLLTTVGAAAESTYPIVQEPITIKVMQWAVENQQVDFENLWFYKELEAKTNIHVEWEVVKDADWKTRLNLMFASGEYPDVIIRGEVDVEEYGVTQGILVPLDDLIPQYMPNYYSRLGMNNVNASIPASDGKTYWIGNLTAQNVNHDGNFFINKAWLDKLDLEVPNTIDELTDVLRKFRDGDPNGNGIKDEIPMSAADLIHQTQGVYTHFANFGVPLTRYVYACVGDDDKLVFPGYMPGFRAACEWLNLCYSEGLLYPESITQDSNVWGTKMNAEQVGYTTYLRLINTALKPEIAAQFTSLLPPASEYGVKVPRILEVPTWGAFITTANKHIPETLRWLDAQFETETMMVSVNGPLQEGGPIPPTIKINDEGKYEIVSIPENNGLYQYVPVIHGQFFAPGDYYFGIYKMPPHRVERYNYSKEYEEAGVLEKNSFYYLYRLVKMDNESSLEAARLYNEIEKFMKESIATFITSGVTDASWQTFLDTAKAVGVERYVELYQAAYDKYLATH